MSNPSLLLMAIDAKLNNDVNAKLRRKYRGRSFAFGVTSVSDLLFYVPERLKGARLGYLLVLGHGKPGFQGIGCGKSSDDDFGLWSLRATDDTKLFGDGARLSELKRYLA